MTAVAQCSVAGCSRNRKARGWCMPHYGRWHRTGDPGPAALPDRRRGTCTVGGCEAPHAARGYCTSHYEKVRRYGDPKAVRSVRVGESAPNWRGDQVAYSTVHSRLNAQRGKARAHSCATCGVTASTWAYRHNDPTELSDPGTGFPYSVDLSRYDPLCKACHSRFDIGRRREGAT